MYCICMSERSVYEHVHTRITYMWAEAEWVRETIYHFVFFDIFILRIETDDTQGRFILWLAPTFIMAKGGGNQNDPILWLRVYSKNICIRHYYHWLMTWRHGCDTETFTLNGSVRILSKMQLSCGATFVWTNSKCLLEYADFVKWLNHF